MANLQSPRITPELIAWLATVFPDSVPTDAEGYDKFLIRVGEQRVIRKLRAEHERQTQHLLEKI